MYSIGAPCVRGNGRSSGSSSPSLPSGSKPGTVPTANRCLTPARPAAGTAVPANRSWATNAAAALSPRM